MSTETVQGNLIHRRLGIHKAANNIDSDLGVDRTSNAHDGEIQTDSSPQARRTQSLADAPFDITQLLDETLKPNTITNTETIFYLAYGSNLSTKAFRVVRRIRPISQVNVLVPELELAFDLPGMPYNEPCFANARYRSTTHLNKYHKDEWRKGLVGVVYEIRKIDYANIIATEGGGAAYQDITVLCYEIPPGSGVVNPSPVGSPFKAHTLLWTSPSQSLSRNLVNDMRSRRLGLGYAQPSLRYLKLITSGAEEHNLPIEYQKFLHELQPYQITSAAQKLGKIVFLIVWGPILVSLAGIGKIYAGADGRYPSWLVTILNLTFRKMWASYDVFFKNVFGDGERTQKGKDSHTRTAPTL